MKVLCLSDLHGHLPDVDSLPDAQLVLLAGDYCRDHRDDFWYSKTFRTWLYDLSYHYLRAVIGVAGNHDFKFQMSREFAESLPWTYLCDSGCEVGGMKIWGSPWQPRFHDWAFNLDEPELCQRWAKIPDDTDILLLHGPPHGYGDFSPYGQVHTGSPGLLKRIEQVKPKLVVAGHIHSGRGEYLIGDTIFVNASHVGEDYKPLPLPIHSVTINKSQECLP